VIKFVSDLRRWFSHGTSVSSTNKIDRHDTTKILLNSKNLSITSAFLIKNGLLLDQAAKILNKEDKLNYFHKHSILIIFG